MLGLIVSIIVIGLIAGALARLVVPGPAGPVDRDDHRARHRRIVRRRIPGLPDLPQGRPGRLPPAVGDHRRLHRCGHRPAARGSTSASAARSATNRLLLSDGRFVVGSDLWSDNDNGRPGLSCPAVAETLRAAASLRSPESALQALIGMLIETGPWTAGSICLRPPGSSTPPPISTPGQRDGDRLQVEFDEGPAHRRGAGRSGPDQYRSGRGTAVEQVVAGRDGTGLSQHSDGATVHERHSGNRQPLLHQPGPTGSGSRATAQVMAAHASVVVAAMTTERHLRRAMLTRNVIGQAQGILMQRHGLTADGAFEYLRQQSQQTNVKLVVLARRIADRGIVPDVGDRD